MRGTEEIKFKNILKADSDNTINFKSLFEIKIGNRIADCVWLSVDKSQPKSTIVFEIKSDKDNLKRLELQVKMYQKAFTRVVVFTTKKHLNNVLKIYEDTEIGIAILDSDVIKYIQAPKGCEKYLDYKTIFSMLRKKEFETLVIEFYGELPETTDFTHYEICFEFIELIPIILVYSFFIRCLNARIYKPKGAMTNENISCV